MFDRYTQLRDAKHPRSDQSFGGGSGQTATRTHRDVHDLELDSVMNARGGKYGLRGVRVGEVATPGPSNVHRRYTVDQIFPSHVVPRLAVECAQSVSCPDSLRRRTDLCFASMRNGDVRML